VKLLLVCSSGGHLLLLHQLRPWWIKHDRSWVTFEKTDAQSLLHGERIHWAYHPTQRNIPNLVRNVGVAWRVLRGERPDVIVSTGAGVAFPFFVLAKLMRIKTVFVEAYERVDQPSLTGRLCYPICDLMVLQWEEQRRFYPRGQLVGALL
jgi:UDP-N-acetylglucosamine:LPS N-acetylglucosamine transferase